MVQKGLVVNELNAILSDIFREDDLFLAGVHRSSADFMSFIQAVTQWGGLSSRDLKECFASLEPCIRQSIIMTLLPAKAFDETFSGSIDSAIDEHIEILGIPLSEPQKSRLRDICINVLSYRGLSSKEARSRTKGIAFVRSKPDLYRRISMRQNERCLWCGVLLDDSNVEVSLEHIAPKHIGGDHYSETNWALSCTSCNSGKEDTFAWPACSKAHDFLTRSDFAEPFRIGLPQRWSVLMRDRKCKMCNLDSTQTELWIFRRVITGLPTPANCGVTCLACSNLHDLDLVEIRWDQKEAMRG
jgi:hypothetical protein